MQKLLKFLDDSPTAWHSVKNVKNELDKHRYVELFEEETWVLKPGGRYYVKRNASSIAAFVLPKKKATSMLLIGGHTDSPGFKLRPVPEYRKQNMVMWGLEVYGSPLISSWLNRDLALAGRIVVKNKKGKISEELVHIKDAPAVIPQLAVHLDRKVNEEGLLLNKQEHVNALAALDTMLKGNQSYLETLLKKSVSYDTLLSFDLMLAPLEPSSLAGDKGELFSSPRIDNLGSVHAALEALIENSEPHAEAIKMTAFWDNEEIGSCTAQGAGSTFVPSIVERLMLSLGYGREEFLRLLPQSFCLSVDVAHALHPNYTEKHEPRHQLLLSKGIALKLNSQQRYATDARTAAKVAALCADAGVQLQRFSCRGDMPCGSTIGPIHATLTGMPSADIGYPILSMHSVRELASSHDHKAMAKLLKAFLA